jgi:hypothetical protein
METSYCRPTSREDAGASPTEAHLAKVGARLAQIAARLARPGPRRRTSPSAATELAPAAPAHLGQMPPPPPRPAVAVGPSPRSRLGAPLPADVAPRNRPEQAGRREPAAAGTARALPGGARRRRRGRGGEGGRGKRRLGFGPLRRPRGASAGAGKKALLGRAPLWACGL